MIRADYACANTCYHPHSLIQASHPPGMFEREKVQEVTPRERSELLPCNKFGPFQRVFLLLNNDTCGYEVADNHHDQQHGEPYFSIIRIFLEQFDTNKGD